MATSGFPNLDPAQDTSEFNFRGGFDDENWFTVNAKTTNKIKLGMIVQYDTADFQLVVQATAASELPLFFVPNDNMNVLLLETCNIAAGNKRPYTVDMFFDTVQSFRVIRITPGMVIKPRIKASVGATASIGAFLDVHAAGVLDVCATYDLSRFSCLCSATAETFEQHIWVEVVR